MSTHSPFGNGKWYKTQIALNTHFILVCRRWFTNANATIKNCLSKQRQRDDDDETHLYFKMCNFFGFSLSVIFFLIYFAFFTQHFLCLLYSFTRCLLARAQITRKLNKSAKLFPLIRFFFCFFSHWVNVVVHSQQSTSTSLCYFTLSACFCCFAVLFTWFNARQPKNLFKDEPFHYYYYKQVYLLHFFFFLSAFIALTAVNILPLVNPHEFLLHSLSRSISFV